MRTVLIIAAVFILTAFSGTAAFAAGQEEQAVVEGASEEITCPNCGEKITVGRHGQTAVGTLKCPKCGKEICPKEEENAVCFGADVAFLSKYVSRGVNYTDGAVFQPYLWVSWQGLTVSGWYNMDLTNKNGLSGNFTEGDYTLDYSGSLDKIGYSAGAIYYTFPHTGFKDTSELYAGLSYDVLLQPKLVIYYDYLEIDGFYGVFSISHSFEMPEVISGVKSSLDLSAQVGFASENYNRNTFGSDHTAFSDMVFTACLPVAISDKVTVKPMVSYSSVLDRTIRTKSTHNDNFIWGGVISASF